MLNEDTVRAVLARLHELQEKHPSDLLVVLRAPSKVSAEYAECPLTVCSENQQGEFTQSALGLLNSVLAPVLDGMRIATVHDCGRFVGFALVKAAC